MGITRDAVMQITGATSSPLRYEDLLQADEIFLTGTSAEIAPVTHLDDRHLEVGPTTKALQATYQDIVHGRYQTWSKWLTYVHHELRPKRQSA